MKNRFGLAVLLALSACRSSMPEPAAAPTSGESGLERVSLLAKGLE
jgi:hypothetical protein